MKNTLTILCVLVLLPACATTDITQNQSGFDKEDFIKRYVDRDTVNMTEFDRQRYYTEHNLGPVPSQYRPDMPKK